MERLPTFGLTQEVPDLLTFRPLPPHLRQLLLLVFFAFLSRSAPAAEPAPVARGPIDRAQTFAKDVVPFLKKHCYECHGPDVQEGEIGFQDYADFAKVAADEKTWTRVLQMIETGVMPPEDSPQPSPAERKRAVTNLEKVLFNVDCDGPVSPGRVTIRRLNRAEYNNTVRDLLGVSFRPADDFPSDDVGSGFDNIGDVLTLPPLLMEKYLAAAEQIAERTIVTDPKQFVKSQRVDRRTLKGDGSASYDDERRRWTLSGKGSIWAEFDLPRDGEYLVRAFAGTRRESTRLKMTVRLGEEQIDVVEVGPAMGNGMPLEFKTQASGGKHRLAISLAEWQEDSKKDDKSQEDRSLRVYGIEIDGPLDVRAQDYPEMHRRVLAIRPDDKTTVFDAARRNLLPIISRAFRRPAAEEEVAVYARLVEERMAEGDSFEEAMQVALTAILVSPHFLFRVEQDPPRANPPAVRQLNDFEVASRLSYFLWSSMPDPELFGLALAGKLQEPATLEQQVRRMLADPKSDALVENFAMQWLNLRLLESSSPDPRTFPDFDNQLKADMLRETQLFCQSIVREDRSILDFLDGRFTFVNERLARHYGLEGIRGDEFQRVAFEDKRRTGVLTQASVLTLTSNPARTSPVKRGKWILDNILGAPPPDPPPDVPELEATAKSNPNLPLRKQLEIHRSNAVCASCHKTMDQLGFGLENFDAVGRWREKDGKNVIDASGQLPSGDKFTGAVPLAGVLKRQKAEFARCLAEKMLVYALGRGLESYDRCAVDKIVEGVEEGDYRFSALVLQIVQSEPFRKRLGEPKP